MDARFVTLMDKAVHEVDRMALTAFVRRYQAGEFSITTLPDGSGVLLDLAQECLLNFNATGAFMLQGLAQGLSEDDVVKQVLERYVVDAGTAAADVARFARQLEQAVSPD